MTYPTIQTTSLFRSSSLLYLHSRTKNENESAPECLATTSESRFSNFRTEGSSPELQRLTAPAARFFNKTIVHHIYNCHISQKGVSSHDAIPIKQFSLLHIALLHYEVTCDENYSPFLIKSIDAIETIFQAVI